MRQSSHVLRMSSQTFQDGFDNALLRREVWIDPPFDATTSLLKDLLHRIRFRRGGGC